ncbi:hypothetical protein HDF16_005325 [Granulicella aggregans]|uniref:Uncharacterized protein n=1 Tax=Granulicella aggregans TaxID=474949 RepID=A0A7W8E6Q6_9BACT|nr:hypothetical protein [Granulicella aggregans]MBB5060589.1 hypothetical protein [Granulicella aggregans]
MERPEGWYVTFLEPDLKTPLPKKFIFQDSAKILELAARGGADKTLADKQALQYAIQTGRGSVWLHLTSAQLVKLNPLHR